MIHRMRWVGRGIAALVFAVALTSAWVDRADAQQLEDVVYLKDGGIIRGTIIEQRPGESILIRTKDGNQFRFTMDQIDRIAKEPVRGAPPAQVPQQARPGGKKAGTAVLWSFLLTGAGQFYNTDYGLGAGLFLTQIVSAPFFIDATVTCYDSGEQCGVSLGLGVIFFGAKIYSIIDAGAGARRYNRRHGYAARFAPHPNVAVVSLRSPQGGSRLGVNLLSATF